MHNHQGLQLIFVNYAQYFMFKVDLRKKMNVIQQPTKLQTFRATPVHTTDSAGSIGWNHGVHC